jgi:hypothetical protein
MCNARSNLISQKHFDLARFAFASNLRKRHESTFNLLNTECRKRKRDKTNIEVGLFFCGSSKTKKNKANECHY